MPRANPTKQHGLGALARLLLPALAAALLLPAFRPDPVPPTVTPVSLPSPPARPMEVLRGTVEGSTPDTLLMRDGRGRLHTFDRAGVLAAGDGADLLPGSAVTVAALHTSGDGQPSRALSIWAKAPSGESAPEISPVRARAQSILDSMTLEEKVGQMFIARCPKSDAPEEAARYALGGYILFTRDFKNRSPQQVAQTVEACQQAAALPLFIGVDEEGGDVVRISKFPAFRDEPFPSPQWLWQSGGLSAVRADTREKCGLLRTLGINLNFAPVCDVSLSPDDYIHSRTLGLDGAQTAQYVRAVVEEMSAGGTGCVLKHFPGYGSSLDTHTSVARDDRPYEAFLQSDFLPFRAGIEAGAGMVLVSHNIVSSMDGERPASLSPKVHEILREELGFQGVIITDDLDMAGAKEFAGVERSAVLAVLAGNDLLCVTDYQRQIPAVLSAVEAGEIPLERIDQSVLRILELKLSLGILDMA